MRRCEIGASRLHQLLVARGGARRRRLAELHDASIGGSAVGVRKVYGHAVAPGADEQPVQPHRPREPGGRRAVPFEAQRLRADVSTMTFLTWARSRSVFGWKSAVCAS